MQPLNSTHRLYSREDALADTCVGPRNHFVVIT